MRRVVVLQSYQDVTDDIKKQLLNNELDELIIKFEANCQFSKIENRIFDSNQEEINFNITFEDSIKTANCFFNKLSRLKTFGKDVNISGNGVVSAELMFGSCEKLSNLPVLVFPKLISADEMFFGCKNLPNIEDFYFPELENANNMFEDCQSIKTVPSFSFPKLKNANCMFADCYALESVPAFKFYELESAVEMFAECKKLANATHLDFPKISNHNGMFAGCSELIKLYQSYTNPYPEFYVPSIHKASFSVTKAFSEFFKFMTDNRGYMGLFKEMSRCRSPFLDSIFSSQNFSLKDEDRTYQVLQSPNLKKELFSFIEHELFRFIEQYHFTGEQYFSDVLMELEKHVQTEISEEDSNNSKKNINIGSYCTQDVLRVRNISDQKYITYGQYSIDAVIAEGVQLSEKYQKKPDLFALVNKIIHELNMVKKNAITCSDDDVVSMNTSFKDYEFYEHGYEDFAEEIKEIEEELDRQNGISPKSSTEDFEKNIERLKFMLHDNRQDNETPKKINEELPGLGKNIFEDMPNDIIDWIENRVKNTRNSFTALGLFCPNEHTLTITMFEKNIKDEALKNNIDPDLLYETVFMHKLFHYYNFIENSVISFALLLGGQYPKNITLFSSLLCTKVLTKIRQKPEISIEKALNSVIMQFIQKHGMKNWFEKYKDISNQVTEPLAVAFEISWIMDRIITQPREKEEWKKVLAYEMKRFGGLSSYPGNPYYGAKYLITTPNDRNNLCHLSVINRNISEILELSSLSMQKAYERIKSLA